jgi:hypothetical protein
MDMENTMSTIAIADLRIISEHTESRVRSIGELRKAHRQAGMGDVSADKLFVTAVQGQTDDDPAAIIWAADPTDYDDDQAYVVGRVYGTDLASNAAMIARTNAIDIARALGLRFDE